jgi:hypothetical protein
MPRKLALKMIVLNLLLGAVGVGITLVFMFVAFMISLIVDGNSIIFSSRASTAAMIVRLSVSILGLVLAILVIIWGNRKLFKRIKAKSEVAPSGGKYTGYVVLLYVVFAAIALFITYAFIL